MRPGPGEPKSVWWIQVDANGGLGSVGLQVGLDALRGFFQPQLL